MELLVGQPRLTRPDYRGLGCWHFLEWTQNLSENPVKLANQSSLGGQRLSKCLTVCWVHFGQIILFWLKAKSPHGTPWMKTDEIGYIEKFTPVKKSAHAAHVYNWEWSVKQTKGAVLVRGKNWWPKWKTEHHKPKHTDHNHDHNTFWELWLYKSYTQNPQNQGFSSSRSFSIYWKNLV